VISPPGAHASPLGCAACPTCPHYGQPPCHNVGPRLVDGYLDFAPRTPPPAQEGCRADPADRLVSQLLFHRGSTMSNMSDMSDETKPVGMWDRTKAWADKNRTISGALVGGAAGTIVPGLGTMIGAIVGAGVGFASSKEKEKKEDR
jgi:hypothetical protein